jgi:alpha-D-xyloside xylohydrolase
MQITTEKPWGIGIVSPQSPTMELLSTSNRGPWDYGDPACNNYRKYAVLHMSLFPYRYAAAQEAARTGMPIMRALVLEYQNDKRAREAKDEYLFGPDLLAAPVIDENTSRAGLSTRRGVDRLLVRQALYRKQRGDSRCAAGCPPALCARGRNPPQNS